MREQVKIVRFEIDAEEIKRTVQEEVPVVMKELAEDKGMLTPARLQKMLDELKGRDSVT